MADSKEKITITLATSLYPPQIGGPATYAVLMESELPKRGIFVETVKFSEVLHLPKVIRHLTYALKLYRAARGSSLIFTQDVVGIGLPALMVARLTGKKFIVRVPGDYAWEQSTQRFGVTDSIDEFQAKRYGWRTETLRLIQRLVVSSADKVIVPSLYFQKLVSGWLFDKSQAGSKVQTIYNGVDLHDVPQAVEHQSRIIVSAGRLVPWKGFDVLIDCMLDLPGWTLKIIGDGPERARLEDAIKNKGLTERVQMLGQLPRPELFRQLAAAEVFVLNTSFESFSYQLVEAMACGVPVIATQVGNLSEIVDDGKNGYLIPVNDRQAIIDKAKEVAASSNAERSVLTAAARDKASIFSIEKTANQLANLIQTLHA